MRQEKTSYTLAVKPSNAPLHTFEIFAADQVSATIMGLRNLPGGPDLIAACGIKDPHDIFDEFMSKYSEQHSFIFNSSGEVYINAKARFFEHSYEFMYKMPYSFFETHIVNPK